MIEFIHFNISLKMFKIFFVFVCNYVFRSITFYDLARADANEDGEIDAQGAIHQYYKIIKIVKIKFKK